MKKTKILAIILNILLIVTLVVPTITFADYQPTTFNGKINTSGASSVESVGGKIVGIIQIVGTIAAVAMLMVLGIKYMMGSSEERAEYKKTLFPYVIGAVLIFAAVNLTQIIYKWAITIKAS